jgi:hypothetical protein
VPVAFVSRSPTRRSTRFNRVAKNVEIGFGLPRHDSSGGRAGVAAVETKADAAHQLLHVWLGEAGIRAACARSGTVQALGQTANERLAIEAGRPRMRLDDLSNSQVCSGPPSYLLLVAAPGNHGILGVDRGGYVPAEDEVRGSTNREPAGPTRANVSSRPPGIVMACMLPGLVAPGYSKRPAASPTSNPWPAQSYRPLWMTLS